MRVDRAFTDEHPPYDAISGERLGHGLTPFGQELTGGQPVLAA